MSKENLQIKIFSYNIRIRDLSADTNKEINVNINTPLLLFKHISGNDHVHCEGLKEELSQLGTLPLVRKRLAFSMQATLPSNITYFLSQSTKLGCT